MLKPAVRVVLGVALVLLPSSFGWAMTSNLCSSVFLFEVPLNDTITKGRHEFGDILHYYADRRLKGPLKDTLRIGTYNVLNLYEHTPRKDKIYPLEKDHARRLGNAKSIHDIDPDFQILVEVENLEAAQAFNKDYLGNRYKPLLIEGNDRGYINIALLVRQNLPIELEWRSYRLLNRKIFSRDLPVGLVYERNPDGSRKAQPKFALLATHYKSKRTDHGQVDNSEYKRYRQVNSTLEVVDRIRYEFGEDLPIILAGDFNSDLHYSNEFSGLFERGFKDTLDFTAHDQEARTTHYYFGGRRTPLASQLDGILVLSDRVEVLSGRVIPDRDADGQALGAPKNYREREERASDHRPVGVEIRLHKPDNPGRGES